MSSKVKSFCLACRIMTILLMLCASVLVFSYQDDIRQFIEPTTTLTTESAVVNGKIQNIDDILTAYLNTNTDASAVAVFKFVPDASSSMYKGQVNLVTSYQEIEDKIAKNWVPQLNNFDGNVQDILFNKVHYETVTSVQVLCEKIYNSDAEFSCDRSKIVRNDVKSIVTIPVLNEQTYAVTGYIMVLLHREFTREQIDVLVRGINPYMQKIQPIISGFKIAEISGRA